MRRIALAVAYDGSRFEGYARQPDRRTVEGELIAALRGSGVLADPSQARFRTGSRTDKGVSAAWNVVAFDTEAVPGQVVAAGSGAPEGLWLLSAADVAGGFDPRRARRRTYRYRLDEAWDWDRVGPVARAFEGAHDYSNFRRADEGKPPWARIDRLRHRATSPGPHAEFVAQFFLWQQVRRIVAALQAVHDGTATPEEVRRALDDPQRRRDFGAAAPENLLLVRVDYEDVAFPPPAGIVRDRVADALAASRRRAALLEAVRGNFPTTRR